VFILVRPFITERLEPSQADARSAGTNRIHLPEEGKREGLRMPTLEVADSIRGRLGGL
jgi:hypothetical protein